MATVEHRPRPVENVADPSAEEARARLEFLYRAHVERVFAICASVLRDRHEVEDAAQQVFVSAFRALLRGVEPRDPDAWLATIARNESWARARRQPSVPLQPELRDVTQEDPSTVVVRRSELARIWRAIEGLPALQREALLLREVRGLGYDELAADLQLSRPSVRSLLNRARRTLRTQLEKGAAALTGAPWLPVLARFFGDASSPALSSASRTAAVGLGVLAITGGAVVAPSLEGQAHQRPAAHGSTHGRVASTSPAGRAGVASPEPVREALAEQSKSSGRLSESHGQSRDDHRSAGGSRSEGPRGSDGASSGDRSEDDGGSDSRGGPGAASGGDGTGSGGTSGTDDGFGDELRSGDEAPRTTSDTSGSTSGGELAGSSTSGVTGSPDDTRVMSTSSSGGDSSGGSGGSGSGGGGGDSIGSSGSDDGSSGPGSSGSGS